MDWIANLHPALQALIRVLLLVVPILMIVPGLIWWERRLLSWMQDRIGPNRVGPFGLLQPIADGVKLFFKEDITPNSVDRVIYFIAPAVALFPAFALGGTLPWGQWTLLTPVADVNVGVLYMLAISSLGVYGVVLAGYGSDNKYSLMGGLRASAQLISYELAMGMSLAAIVLASGSLRMTDMVKAQEQPLYGIPQLQNWFIFTPFGLVAGIIFLICMVAETNRAPFDLPEAENELIAGYHTEYSSMKFAVFFMGEYAAMFVFSGIFATVFLGGYAGIVPIRFEGFGLDQVAQWNRALGPIWFITKCALGMSLYIWLRATLPRLRYDQLMSLGWRSLLPLAVANFIIVAAWLLITELYGAAMGWATAFGAVIIGLVLFGVSARSSQGAGQPLERRTITLVDGNPKSEMETAIG